MATISLAEKLRKNLNQALEDNKSDYTSDVVPDYGKTKVRIIPGAYSFGTDNELFYWVHPYHFIPGKNKEEKGQYVFTHQEFPDGSKCPIDESVEELFKSTDKQIKKIASTIKRKRAFYFHALLYEDGKEPKLIVLKDNTADGKLAAKICSIMGLPFVKDPTQKRPWILKSEVSPGKPLYDLIDFDNGHDLIIDKRKGKAIPLDNGQVIHDIDYSETFAWAEPRKLSPEEREMVKELPDLKTINKVETDRKVVENILNQYLETVQVDETPAATNAKVETPKAAQKNPALNVKTETAAEEVSEEDIINEITKAAQAS